MSKEQLTLSKPQRGVVGHSALEVGAWLVALCTAALAYAIAGVHGFSGVMDASQFRIVTEAQRAGEFAQSTGACALLVIAVLMLAGLLVPFATVRKLGATQRTQLLFAMAVGTSCVALIFVFVPAVWLAFAVAVLLGVLVAMIAAHTPQLHRKPWRTAGLAAGILLFTTYLFQLTGGIPAGTGAVRWVLLAGAVILAASAVLVLISPLKKDDLPQETAGFPLTRSLQKVRGHMDVTFAWACYVLFGLLGAVFVLALPAVADHAFGQAGFVLIVAAVLFGWAAGYEAGPTFAPGMTRPRLTSFALIAAAIFTLGAGVISELSGKAVLSALVAFCVGVGVRAQNYTFSRRVGVTAGVGISLLLACLNITFDLRLSAVSTWFVTGSAVAYMVVGCVGLIAGIAAVFVFAPQGVQGLGIDLVHAFRAPHEKHVPHVIMTEEGHANAPGHTPADGHDVPAEQHAAEPTGAGAVHLVASAAHEAQAGSCVAVEAGDGAGKTTQVAVIRDVLEAAGYDPVVVTREPGGTDKGCAIRHTLLDGEGVTARSEALLYAADRAHHVASLIAPTLDAGGAVVTDRYVDSSLAYQAGGRELSQADVLALSRWATEGLIPHVTFVLDVDLQRAHERLSARSETNHFDVQDREFKERVRQGFLALATAYPQRYIVIDANRPVEQVSADIRAELEARVSTAVADSTAAQPKERAADETQADEAPAVQIPPEEIRSEGIRPERIAANEAETTVLPARGEGFVPAAPRGRFDGVPTEPMTADQPEPDEKPAPNAQVSAEEAPTTVFLADRPSAGPPRDAEHVSSDEDAPTTVLRRDSSTQGSSSPSGAAQASSSAAHAAAAGEARVEPAAQQPARRLNAERLRAQARIERQARERLRQARERGSQ